MNPNDFGKKLLVENCQKISIDGFLRIAKSKIKETLLTSIITVGNTSLTLKSTKTGFGGKRYWFACPICTNAVGALFIHPVRQTTGCRVCLGLDYRKRRYKGMVENNYK